MAQNVAKSDLTGAQLKAAVYVAADDLTDEQIADAVGVSRRTLIRWREIPEFMAEVAKQEQAIVAKALKLPIARKYKRLTVLNDLHEKALAVIDARALEYGDNPEVAGGGTGLIIRDVKAVGSGRDAQVIEVFGVDVSLMKEIRGIQEQAAKETGDWSENVNLTGSMTSTVELVGVLAEDV